MQAYFVNYVDIVSGARIVRSHQLTEYSEATLYDSALYTEYTLPAVILLAYFVNPPCCADYVRAARRIDKVRKEDLVDMVSS